MPNKAAAAKAWRQMKKHATHNQQIRSKVEVALRLARRALTAKASDAGAKVKTAVQLMDRAAQKGVLKRNTSSRLKSRLVSALGKAKR